MLLLIVGCMLLTAVIEYVLWILALRFFEWRFLKKAESICCLYDSVITHICNDNYYDKPLKISVNFEHFKSKVKFHNSLEAILKIELLIHRAMRDYKIARFLDGTENPSVKFEIDECKEHLEEICSEMRSIINNQTQEVQQKEL